MQVYLEIYLNLSVVLNHPLFHLKPKQNSILLYLLTLLENSGFFRDNKVMARMLTKLTGVTKKIK